MKRPDILRDLEDQLEKAIDRTRQLERLAESSRKLEEGLRLVIALYRGEQVGIDDSRPSNQSHAVIQEEVPAEASLPPSLRSIREVLLEAGEPLHFREIYRRLRERGRYVSGNVKYPENAVNAQLSRRKDLFRILQHGTGVYGLREWGPVERWPARQGKAGQVTDSHEEADQDELDLFVQAQRQENPTV